jgi:hypothetical protein
MVGNRAIYVAPMGGVVRDIGYDINADGFTGEDISIYANHLFKGKTVVEMAYAQEPDSVVYCVMSDGTMNTLTYVREHEVLAWTHQETGGGDDLYESVCTIPGDGFDEVWVIVNRNGGRYVEKFVPRDTSGDIEDQFYVHSGIIYDGAAATTISGLDHLEGETVAILADGYVLAQQVVSSGDITLATAATKVIVGLPYTSDVETLNIELNLPDGTTQDRDVLVGEVTVRFLDSRGGWIGPDSSHLDEVVQITDPPMGEPTPLYTGDFKQELNSQYDKGGRVFYRQVDPLPFTILSLIPVVTVGD